MGHFKDVFTEAELEWLRAENESLRAEVERLTELVDTYAVCFDALDEPARDGSEGYIQ